MLTVKKEQNNIGKGLARLCYATPDNRGTHACFFTPQTDVNIGSASGGMAATAVAAANIKITESCIIGWQSDTRDNLF
jgi:hypothetical protein